MLNRRQLLLGGAAACAAPPMHTPVPGKSGTRAKRIVVVVVKGGWDPLFCFEPRVGDTRVDGPERDQDPTIADDVEYTRTFGDVTLVVNDHKRPNVTRFFDRWMPQTAIVNGIWTGAVAHSASMVRMLTGTRSESNPDFAAIVGDTWGRDLPLGYVDLAGGAFPGLLAPSSGTVGHRAQILNLLDQDRPFTAPSYTNLTYPQFRSTAEDDAAVATWLKARTERFQTRQYHPAESHQRLDDRFIAMERAARLRTDALEMLSSLNLGRSASASEANALAVDLLESNLCSSVLFDTRFDWDTHSNHVLQHGFYNNAFAGLDTLMTQLSERDMLKDTMVVVVSEMTKSPLISTGEGKNHWPHASVMLMGAGVQGGRVYGGYDSLLESEKVDYGSGDVSPSGELLKYDNFIAGLLNACDVDAGGWLTGVTPFRAFLSA